MTYSYGPPHMAKQKQDDQPELTYSSYVRTQDVTQKTCRRRWMIGRSGERWSRISVLAARHDDDDECDSIINWITILVLSFFLSFFLSCFQDPDSIDLTDIVNRQKSFRLFSSFSFLSKLGYVNKPVYSLLHKFRLTRVLPVKSTILILIQSEEETRE